jgi:uncharacterized protein YjiS (DUF1127 family)
MTTRLQDLSDIESQIAANLDNLRAAIAANRETVAALDRMTVHYAVAVAKYRSELERISAQLIRDAAEFDRKLARYATMLDAKQSDSLG